MAPKHHPTPLSGGDRKALQKELGHARAMTTNLATQAAEARAKGEALIRQADRLLPSSPGTSFSGRPHSGHASGSDAVSSWCPCHGRAEARAAARLKRKQQKV
ncbi:hypothetical protein M2175_004238 [Bradyrhizobium elkanii]|uniref:hypothetical protein n=1 Tax=Bradyrhizobium japonicum TaxID=375 RepID=UPI0004B50B80|nr:hypothetical protein [Bradyrhizobium japonicum]MCS3929207.1 hypothetical protein [Bradyrhizobium elkanii]MCS3969763.1 hypothetical protein [Bradyrhizobium japonicum]